MKKLLFIAVIVGLISSCSDKHEHQHGMDADEHHEMAVMTTEGVGNGAVLRKVREDEIGKAVTCPVMGTKFKVKANTQVADYNGKSYYFCCAGCPGPFKNNPGEYINKQ